MIKHAEIKNKLRELGYDAKFVNGDCFDIMQDGRIHYLTTQEARDLLSAKLNHPVNLIDYGVKSGLNYWYTF